MSNKLNKKTPLPVTAHETEELVSVSAAAKVEEVVKEASITFGKKLWRGIKTVFVCTKCGQSHDLVDDVIEHILLHYEPSQRMKELERLLKEK